MGVLDKELVLTNIFPFAFLVQDGKWLGCAPMSVYGLQALQTLDKCQNSYS